MGLLRMQSVLFRICLCRVISLLLFTWPDFSLPHLQLTSAYSLISRPASSSARRQIVSFLAHCGHARFQICLERWLFFLHCSFLFVSTCLHSIFLCSSYLTCLASSSLRTCLLQPQLSFVVFSWIKTLELCLSVLVHTSVLCLGNSYVNATSLFANVYLSIYSVQRTCKFYWRNDYLSMFLESVYLPVLLTTGSGFHTSWWDCQWWSGWWACGQGDGCSWWTRGSGATETPGNLSAPQPGCSPSISQTLWTESKVKSKCFACLYAECRKLLEV